MIEDVFVQDKDSGGLSSQAYLVLGNIKKSVDKLGKLISNYTKVSNLQSSPDHFIKIYDSFGVKDSRDLKRKENTKALSGEKRFFVLASNSFTIEAQNALLKVLEEPKSGHYLFVVTTSGGTLLPTLMSRMTTLSGEQDIEEEFKKLAKKFWESNAIERIKMIDVIAPKDKKDLEENESRNQRLLDFVSALEETVYNHLSGGKNKRDIYAKLEKISKAKDYANDKSSSPRLILEFLALAV